jgi:hypothetical protein
VDFDSGEGSSLLFGIIFAAIGLAIGYYIIGGWIAIGLGGIIGYSVGSQFIGKIIYVNIFAIILAIACGIFIAILARWIGHALFPRMSSTIESILFIIFMVAGTVLFLISRIYDNKILLVILILLGIGGGITLTKPNFTFGPPRSKSTTGQTASSTVTVTADSLNFRAGPSTEHNIIKTLKKGDTLTITGNIKDGWAPVRHDGDTGWVSAELIGR